MNIAHALFTDIGYLPELDVEIAYIRAGSISPSFHKRLIPFSISNLECILHYAAPDGSNGKAKSPRVVLPAAFQTIPNSQ
jgi:hypothetical protein